MLERRERRLADDEPHALRGEHSRTVVMTKFTLQGKRAPILTLSWHMEDVFDTCGPLGSAHFQDHFDVQTSTVTSFGVSTRRRRRIGGRFRVVRVGARTGRVARRLGTRNSANLYPTDAPTWDLVMRNGDHSDDAACPFRHAPRATATASCATYLFFECELKLLLDLPKHCAGIPRSVRLLYS